MSSSYLSELMRRSKKIILFLSFTKRRGGVLDKLDAATRQLSCEYGIVCPQITYDIDPENKLQLKERKIMCKSCRYVKKQFVAFSSIISILMTKIHNIICVNFSSKRSLSQLIVKCSTMFEKIDKEVVMSPDKKSKKKKKKKRESPVERLQNTRCVGFSRFLAELERLYEVTDIVLSIFKKLGADIPKDNFSVTVPTNNLINHLQGILDKIGKFKLKRDLAISIDKFFTLFNHLNLSPMDKTKIFSPPPTQDNSMSVNLTILTICRDKIKKNFTQLEKHCKQFHTKVPYKFSSEFLNHFINQYELSISILQNLLNLMEHKLIRNFRENIVHIFYSFFSVEKINLGVMLRSNVTTKKKHKIKSTRWKKKMVHYRILFKFISRSLHYFHNYSNLSEELKKKFKTFKDLSKKKVKLNNFFNVEFKKLKNERSCKKVCDLRKFVKEYDDLNKEIDRMSKKLHLVVEYDVDKEVGNMRKVLYELKYKYAETNRRKTVKFYTKFDKKNKRKVVERYRKELIRVKNIKLFVINYVDHDNIMKKFLTDLLHDITENDNIASYKKIEFFGYFTMKEILGKGIMFYPNKRLKFHGRFKRGTLSRKGKAIEYDEKGNMIFHGLYKRNKRHGKGILYAEDGTWKRGTWKKGELKKVHMTSEKLNM